MKICFLDNNPIGYSSKDINCSKIRGAENALINLATNFSKAGNEVVVFNNIKEETNIDNVSWFNLKRLNKFYTFDIAITNNDIRLLDKIISSKKFAISHSIQTIEKFIRQKQLLSYIKNKPKILLLGKYHQENRSLLLKVFGSNDVEWGVDEIFINSKINDNPLNQAIFTSRPDRNLNILLDIWKNKICKFAPKSKMIITPIEEDYRQYNIFNRNLLTKKELVKDLLNSKVAIFPGHKAELYCIAAEEAKELCLPIVTLGIGSLSERVEHGVTGLVAKNSTELGNYILDILNNESIYNKIRNNLKLRRGQKNWKKISKKILKLLNE